MNNAVDEAYRALPIRDTAEHRLPFMVDLVSRFPSQANSVPSFSKIGRVSAEREIANLSAKIEGLIDCLEGLHGKSIDALASAGFVNDRFRLMDLLKVAKEAAKSASILSADDLSGRGRKPDFLARGVSRILAFDYSDLTGKPPTVTTDSYLPGYPAGGEFFEFVRAVFLALGIEASPETWARSAAQAWRVTAKEKKPI
jgi:hypothetical protein